MALTLCNLIDNYNCDDKCRELLERLRFGDKVYCTRCGSVELTDLPKHDRYECKHCKYQFSVTSGTIMHDSHLPLRKWFIAIYLMCESRKGISANQLKRVLGVQYRTAWHLCHRIREAMSNDPLTGPSLVGVVEADEMLVGGKTKGKGAGYRGNKTWVAGAIQRDGELRLERITNNSKPVLHDFINRNVQNEAEATYTDELNSYLGIETETTKHETVNHSEYEWVAGDVHTNGIEGIWSLFKRSIVGAFHKMSVKHMDRYLEEMEWRFNNRDNPHIFRDTLSRIVNTRPLTYKELTKDVA